MVIRIKQILSIFFIFNLPFFFSGCEKNEPVIEENPEIILSVKFSPVNTNNVSPDVFSKVYIYYGLLKTDVQHYKLNESKDGILHHERDNSKIIYPDSIGTVDIHGEFSMFPKKEINKILFQIVSNHYQKEGFKMFLSEDLSYYQDKYRHSITFTHWEKIDE